MPAIVVRRIVEARIRTRLRFRIRTRIGTVPANARTDHANVNVRSRSECSFKSGRTNSFGCGRPNPGSYPIGVDARRIGEPLKQCRNGFRQEELLLRHPARIVDRNDQVYPLGTTRTRPASRTASSRSARSPEHQGGFGFTTNEGEKSGRAKNTNSSVAFHARIEPSRRADVKYRTTSAHDKVDVRAFARYSARSTSEPLRYGSHQGFVDACFE